MNIGWKIFRLITHLVLVILVSLALVMHIATGNVFGMVAAVIAIVCWLTLTIFDIMDIKRYYKQNKLVKPIEVDMNNDQTGRVEYRSFYDKCKKECFVVTKESQDTINSKYTFEAGNHGF